MMFVIAKNLLATDPFFAMTFFWVDNNFFISLFFRKNINIVRDKKYVVANTSLIIFISDYQKNHN